MSKIKNALAAATIGAFALLSFAPMVTAASLTSAQTQAILALLSSFGADSATISNVEAALNGTPSVVVSSTSAFKIGDTGAGVTSRQKQLVAEGYLKMPVGVAYGYYGKLTAAAEKAEAAASASSAPTSVTPVTPAAGTTLKVSVSPTSPNGSVLVQGQAIGDLADFTFANTTATPASVTSLSFNRTGVSNDSTLDNVYLYNGVTRITDSAGVSNSSFSFSDPVALFTVPANSSVTVSVRADIAGGSSGQQVGASLVSVVSTGTLDSSVSFPITSGVQTISAADLAKVDFADMGTPSSVTVSPQVGYMVWDDTVSVTGNPVSLNSIRFTNLGSVDASSVTNLRLLVDGSKVGNTVAQIGADRTVTFDLSAAPAALSTQTHDISVVADIVGGASRTMQFSVQRSSDAMFVDSQLKQPVRPKYKGSSFATISADQVTVQSVGGTSGSGVAVTVDPTSPNQDVAYNASSVKLASFDFVAPGEATKVTDLNISSTVALANGRVYLNGAQVGSTKNLGVTGSPTDFSFGSSLILPAGVTSHIDVSADTTNNPSLLNNTVQVTIEGGSAQGLSSLNTVSIPSTPANTVTVAPTTISAAAAPGFGAQSYIPSSNGMKIGELVLSTGSTEGVTVNKLSVDLGTTTLRNLTLKDASGVVLGTVTTPQATNNILLSFDVPASSSKTVDVYADISASSAGSFNTTVTASGKGDSTKSLVTSSAQPLQTITVGSGSAALVATSESWTPDTTLIVAGAQKVKVGQFNFAATNSSYTIRKLDVKVTGSGVSNVYLQGVAGAAAFKGSGVYEFSGLSIPVASNQDIHLAVSVDVAALETSGAVSGGTVSVALATTTNAAIDSASNSVNIPSAVADGNTFTVYKSVPTLAIDTGSASVSGPLLAQVTVSANGAGKILWSALGFRIATSSATVTGLSLTDDASGATIAGAFVGGVFTATNPQQVVAGASKTYDLYGDVAQSSNYPSVSVSFDAPTTMWSGDSGATFVNASSVVGVNKIPPTLR